MGRAFPPHPGCPVPSVSAITGVLVSSCKIDPPADPIFSFPIFAMPIPNPPSFNFGCYKPTAVATVAFNQVTPYFSATIRFPRSSDTGNCQPQLKFNVGFPASNCPDISASGSIHLLPPRTSPSLSLSVHKASDSCSFRFKLSIGIPGGQCTSVTTEETDLPDFVVHNGDHFFVDDNFNVEEDDSGTCTLFKLTFDNTKIVLDIAPIMGLQPNAVAAPECCANLTIVTAITGWAYPVVGGLTQPQLQFNTTNIQLPQVQFLEEAGPLAKSVPCGAAFNAIVGFETVPPDLCPCGLDVTPSLNAYTIEPPTITTDDDPDGTDIVLSAGTGIVVTGITIGGTPCAPVVTYHTATIRAGGLTGDLTGVQDISCSGGSLSVTFFTLGWDNGILVSGI